jgi:acyl-CoA reductase-like NAD-dependent aldehyde dehydrogenase
MVNEFHYNRVCYLLKGHGGKVVMGNAEGASDKREKLKPTVILNPNKESALMQEEIFGPIFPIFTFKNIDEPIKYIRE